MIEMSGMITLELGIPYRDMLSKKEFTIRITKERTIEDVMEAFLASYPSIVEQSSKRGYYKDGKIKAVYTNNGRLVPIDEEIEDGDWIKVILPIVGG
jgi:molybdopterin converting factor small subunit